MIVRREGERYYAVLKDEQYPTFDWPTGKAIRISSAPALLGPYSEPSPRITPDCREALTVIPRPDGRGWYLYYEQYPGVMYSLSTAEALVGPWYDIWCEEYSVPEAILHGCMIATSQAQYDAIVAAY